MQEFGRISAALLCALCLSGCVTDRTSKWGETSTLRPGWDRVGRAAKDALLHPNTLIPLIGAASFVTFDIDEDVSDWAIDKTPVFGSNNNAETYSDVMIYATTAAYYGSGIINDSGTAKGDAKEISWNKTKAMVTGFGAFVLDFGTTEVLKELTDRDRPDGRSSDSFPSLHTSGATIQATLAARNLEYTPLSDAGRIWLTTGLYTLSGSIGWARVEAGHHYPSDVLAGYALGNFIGMFINDAFVDPYRRGQITATLGSESESGWRLGWEQKF